MQKAFVILHKVSRVTWCVVMAAYHLLWMQANWLKCSWRMAPSCSRAIRHWLSATDVLPLKMQGRPCSYRMYACISQSWPHTRTPCPRSADFHSNINSQCNDFAVQTSSRLVWKRALQKKERERESVAYSCILLSNVMMSSKVLKESREKRTIGFPNSPRLYWTLFLFFL